MINLLIVFGMYSVLLAASLIFNLKAGSTLGKRISMFILYVSLIGMLIVSGIGLIGIL